jgi:hypothetical protein
MFYPGPLNINHSKSSVWAVIFLLEGYKMFEPNMAIPRRQGKTKAGLTISLNQQENREPFEVTVFFKNPDESGKEETVSITASGKLVLNIGKRGRVELFGENTQVLKQLEEKEEQNEMPCV